MKPFLKQVAEQYVANYREGLIDTCFVFPNKRAGVFFSHYLSELLKGESFVMPDVKSIGEFTAQFSDRVEASRLDQLFILFNEYRALSGDVGDFEKFLFWGEMLLADFNDVDRDLVDADKLFVNLKRYREVSADYLTPEQKEILARYWGEEFIPQSPDRFWQHLHDKSTPLEAKFLKLWEVLADLYHRFHARLAELGLATTGIYARHAVESLRTEGTRWLNHRRYVFVGFNVLTLSEIKMFDLMQTLGVADFYWDMGSHMLQAEGNRALRFMARNVKSFPSLYPLPEEELRTPRIRVTGVPSSTGQATVTACMLKQWVKEKEIPNVENAMETAVILPDEGLFVPMLHAIPKEFGDPNITMGFPLRSTSFASFVNSIVGMQLRAKLKNDRWCYYYEDVKTLISHPLSQKLAPEGCAVLSREIATRRLYFVDSVTAAEKIPELAFLFTPIADVNSPVQVYGYFSAAFDRLEQMFAPKAAEEASDEESRLIAEEIREQAAKEGRDPDSPKEGALEVFFIKGYREALNDLHDAVMRYGIEMRDSTFIQLMQRAVSSGSINFTGEPLAGLQVMGVLETRALDFENIVMLSMNERVFPARQYKRSFIPDNLRKSYGMSTTEHQESIYAYYFYRLISRARNVELLYDARSSAGKSSEMSRYIAQLFYLFPECQVTHEVASFEVSPPREFSITIPKDEEAMRRMDEFRAGGPRSLSASAINKYINCPLSFFLTYLCGLNLDEEVMDYMDSSTYGRIVHDVLERIYKGLRGDADQVRITPEILEYTARQTGEIEKIITERVNAHYNRLPDGTLDKLTGEAKVLGDVMLHFIAEMLRAEKAIAPFDFIEAEEKLGGVYTVDDTLAVNINQIIDRVDRVCSDASGVTDRLRIVDYKTGSDEMKFSSMDQLFDPKNDARRKAILQLLFYCKAYAEKMKYTGDIQPVIYSFKEITKEKVIKPITYDKRPLLSYKEVDKEFSEAFGNVIREMFNPEVPFTQAKSDHACKFCSFKPICHKVKS